MGIYKDIKNTEMELFNLLEKAFKYINNGQYKDLKLCVDLIIELEKDYYSMTKTKFIDSKVIKRLITELQKHGYK